MPKFPAFGKRKSAMPKEEGDVVPSFRVLERPDPVGVKSFDDPRAVRRPVSTARPYSQVDNLAAEENMFANLHANRGSGSSNTTKTASTDTSSRHSAVSTAPSSAAPPAEFNNHHHPEDTSVHRKPFPDIPLPPPPKASGFLNRAGRTFSFGNSKKGAPPVPTHEVPPPVPTHDDPLPRARGMTSSTTSTATPPKLSDEQFSVDLGDFGTMFKGFDKRASTATVRDEAPKGMPPRSLTSNRITSGHLVPPQTNAPPQQQPQPHSPHSINSEHSNDGLLDNKRSPVPPPHTSSYNQRNPRPSEEDEHASLLKQSVAASRSLEASGSGGQGSQGGRYRGNDDTGPKGGEDDNMFDNTFISTTRAAQRYAAQPPSPPRNKVMTPAQFEKFKQEKERAATRTKSKAVAAKDEDDDEDDDYEDDEDEVEKSKQAAKQRRKQEAHMSVYRQQMMKVTGESAPAPPPPRQYLTTPAPMGRSGNTTDGSDEDEEIPLAILAAHGFPAKSRAPSRLSTVGSNPNLRASMGATPPPQPSRASTLALGEHPGKAAGARSSQLPAFARRLPQDPFVGAGLVRNPARESIAMGGGAPHPSSGPLPPGGLVGVIASEERSRAMRRATPHLADGSLIHNVNGNPNVGVDPMTGMSPQMMYGMGNGNSSTPHLGGTGFQQPPALSAGDQAQIQMTQQMQQFMHMQMQFMQMMTGNQNQGAGGAGGAGGARPNSFMGGSPMGDMPSRQSYFGGSEYQTEQQRPQMNEHMRTMSMVQPSSSSWIQPMPGYAPSIRVQGEGYAPSIAPSERSNVGLPGRYRPVSQMPGAAPEPMKRASTMTGALGSWDDPQKPRMAPSPTPPGNGGHGGNQSDEDDEEGWMAMKAKREKKKSIWKSKKGFGKEMGALIS